MTRSFACCLFFAAGAFGCNRNDRIQVRPAPPEHQEVDLAGTGCILTYELPDETWKGTESETGFRYASGGCLIDLAISLEHEPFVAVLEALEDIMKTHVEAGASVVPLAPDPLAYRAGFDAECPSCSQGPTRFSMRIARVSPWPFVAAVLVHSCPSGDPMPTDEFLASFRVMRR